MGNAPSSVVNAVGGVANLVKDAAVATYDGVRTGVGAGLEAARRSWLKTPPESSPQAELAPIKDLLAKAIDLSNTFAIRTAPAQGASDPAALSLLQQKQSADQEVERLKKLLQETEKKIEEDWPKPQHLTHDYINVAFTGESGVGKSSLINKICGMKPSDPGAAQVGAGTETTQEVTFYTSARYPGVRFWDLPGAGTPNNPAATYLRDRGIRYYDSLQIVTRDRFMETDGALFKEATRWKIPANIVRNKMDEEVKNNKEDKQWTEEMSFKNTLEDVKKRTGATPDSIFLIATKNYAPGSRIECELGRLEAKVHEDVQRQRARAQRGS